MKSSNEHTAEQIEYARYSARELLLKPCRKESAGELNSIGDQLLLLEYPEDAVRAYNAAIATSITPFFIQQLRQKLDQLEQKTDKKES